MAPEDLPFPLPVFRTPIQDDDCPILAVFVEYDGGDRAALHVVTADEDHPLPLVDQLYDAHRWFGLVAPSRRFPFVRIAPAASGGYRRIADIETVELVLGGSGGQRLEAIRFPGTYSREQGWNVLLARHHSATIPAREFDFEGARPVLHVNTWNHLFGERSTNPGARHRLVRDYPVRRGTRAELQALYDGVWSDFGLGL